MPVSATDSSLSGSTTGSQLGPLFPSLVSPQEGWNTDLDGILVDLTVDAFTQRGVFSRWNKHKPPVKCVRGWEQISEEFNKRCNRHGSDAKTPTALACRLSFLKKQFKLGGTPTALNNSLTHLFKNNRVTIPSFMTECGEDERPRSRSPTRTAPGSSGPRSSASFATPPAGSTSYASPTCATPSAAEYKEVNKILTASGINSNAIPYIVGAITSSEAKGLIHGPEYTRRSFIDDLQMRYHQPYQPYQPYRPYQPHDFR